MLLQQTFFIAKEVDLQAYLDLMKTGRIQKVELSYQQNMYQSNKIERVFKKGIEQMESLSDKPGSQCNSLKELKKLMGETKTEFSDQEASPELQLIDCSFSLFEGNVMQSQEIAFCYLYQLYLKNPSIEDNEAIKAFNSMNPLFEVIDKKVHLGPYAIYDQVFDEKLFNVENIITVSNRRVRSIMLSHCIINLLMFSLANICYFTYFDFFIRLEAAGKWYFAIPFLYFWQWYFYDMVYGYKGFQSWWFYSFIYKENDEIKGSWLPPFAVLFKNDVDVSIIKELLFSFPKNWGIGIVFQP